MGPGYHTRSEPGLGNGFAAERTSVRSNKASERWNGRHGKSQGPHVASYFRR
ncbi:hypothetical protein M413DRAFT_442680 [Hebeloma cylindrosporum]|uniref:Uncharacterized protein n=1 Tax=Hebeloma cylindrosporum TaxID=76867 RepID=A0A0C3C797_HEBCY|nr:hypothetical protein M413DRAFT_442680 [Hebeloma cylindrosporum h7]